MARNIDAIQQQIITNVQADADLSALNSTSHRAIWRLFTYVCAAAIGILEQLMDALKAQIEDTAAKAPPSTPAWLQDKVFQFQYSASVPQVLQLVNFVPAYPTVDTSLRIITRCSVKTDLANNVKIKVAKGSPPVALSSAEITALQGYVINMGMAGINHNIISLNPDQIYIAASIYYKGQYSSVIAANVQAAINAYLAALPFDGTLKISDLEIAIRETVGVTDVVLTQVRLRADTDAFSAGTDLVLASQTLARTWNTVAGYLITETTTGQTINDSLTFIAE